MTGTCMDHLDASRTPDCNARKPDIATGTVMPTFHLPLVLLTVALPASPPVLDQRGDSTAWVFPPPE